MGMVGAIQECGCRAKCGVCAAMTEGQQRTVQAVKGCAAQTAQKIAAT